MVNRRARGKQQNISRVGPQPAADTPAGTTIDDRVRHLLKLANDFDAAAEQCASSSNVQAVHHVRTVSRRLQAMVETMEREAGTAATFAEQVRPWLRQLKKIRRAAGPVRDLDVHRKLLASWEDNELPLMQSRQAADIREPDQDRRAADRQDDSETLSRQAAELDRWLKKRREELAGVLQKEIRARREKLARGREAAFAACGLVASRSKALRPAAALALEDFVRLSEATPSLDAGNLHDFRKAVKKARYVAESGGERESAKNVAEALKRVQDAIGDWHDWLCLAQEAKLALGHDGPALRACFDGEAERRFHDAIKIAEAARGRLLGEWLAAENQSRGRLGNAQARKSPRRSDPSQRAPAARNAAGAA